MRADMKTKGGGRVKINLGSFAIAAKVAKFLKSALVDGSAWFDFKYRGIAIKVTFVRLGPIRAAAVAAGSLVGAPFESFFVIAQIIDWAQAVFNGEPKKVGQLSYGGQKFKVTVQRI